MSAVCAASMGVHRTITKHFTSTDIVNTITDTCKVILIKVVYKDYSNHQIIVAFYRLSSLTVEHYERKGTIGETNTQTRLPKNGDSE